MYEKPDEIVPPTPAETKSSFSAKKKSVGKKLFSMNFILLLQGNFVSEIGNNIHSMAMAFWLLQKTGSTAVMGIISSLGMLVHSMVCLFSGAVIDKTNKRNVLVLADMVQGLLFTTIGLLALLKVLDLWMVAVIYALAGIGSAFFFPASQAMIPEMVPENKLMKANAFMLMIVLAAPIIGNGAGGFLFRRYGAPLLFIGNGISFLISAFSEAFINITGSEDKKKKDKATLLEDVKTGYDYLVSQKGLRFFLILNMLINLAAFTGLFLILPFFERTPDLGPANFGLAMACLAGGGLLSSVYQKFSGFPHPTIDIENFDMISLLHGKNG